MATSLPKILKDKTAREIVRDRMDILTHKVLMAKMVDQGKAKWTANHLKEAGHKGAKDKMDLVEDQVVCHRKMVKTVDQAKGIGMVNLHKMGCLKIKRETNKIGTPIKSPLRSPLRKKRQAIQNIHQRMRQGQRAKKKVEIANWMLLNEARSCYNRVENTHHPFMEEWEGEIKDD